MNLQLQGAIARHVARLSMLMSTVAVIATAVAAQEPADVQRLFEGGQYQQVVDAVTPAASPSVLFIAAVSAQKLGANDRAMSFLDQLSKRADDDAWHYVGLSATQLLQRDEAGALESANRAVALDMALPEASYALGLVLVQRQDWGAAAMAFDRVSTLRPGFAYAYYYAGLSHSRSNRPDLMAIRFEQFLKLAPNAPERTEVTQIMRTVRGR